MWEFGNEWLILDLGVIIHWFSVAMVMKVLWSLHRKWKRRTKKFHFSIAMVWRVCLDVTKIRVQKVQHPPLPPSSQPSSPPPPPPSLPSSPPHPPYPHLHLHPPYPHLLPTLPTLISSPPSLPSSPPHPPYPHLLPTLPTLISSPPSPLPSSPPHPPYPHLLPTLPTLISSPPSLSSSPPHPPYPHLLPTLPTSTSTLPWFISRIINTSLQFLITYSRLGGGRSQRTIEVTISALHIHTCLSPWILSHITCRFLLSRALPCSLNSVACKQGIKSGLGTWERDSYLLLMLIFFWVLFSLLSVTCTQTSINIFHITNTAIMSFYHWRFMSVYLFLNELLNWHHCIVAIVIM